MLPAMPPAKRKAPDAPAPKAKHRAAPWSCADQRMPPDESRIDGQVNVEFVKEFEEMIGAVLDMYEGIQDSEGLGTFEGGQGALFNQALCSQAIANAGCYNFHGSVWLHDLRWRPHPELPINDAWYCSSNWLTSNFERG